MKRGVMAWAACALLAVHGIAHAQQATEASAARSPVEITPYAALGSGAVNGVGTAVRWGITPKLGLELEMGVRPAEITAMAIAVSLVYDLPAIGRVVPYAAAGIGLEQYVTAFYHPTLGVVRGTDTAISVNTGGGLRIPIDDRWGVRTDARWFTGITGDKPERWRIYNGATLGIGKH